MRITKNPKEGILVRIDLHTKEELDKMTCLTGSCPVNPANRPECKGCSLFRRRIFNRVRKDVGQS